MAIDSPTNGFGKTAKGAKTATGFAQKTRQFIQVAKVLVKGGAGPAGWAVAAAQILAPLIKKIKKAAAIVGGVIALRILMHIMQLAGLVAGLAFGAISGLPLLLIPVAGPFLYVGWVGFWGYRGFTNPFDTIQLATHPWELITRPLNWLGQRFSDLGSYFKGGTETLGSGVNNVVSSAFYHAGNFVTGLASSLWGGVTSAVGNAAGWFSSAASHALGLASTVTSSAASIVSVGVGGAVAVVGVGSFLVAATNIVQLSTIEGDLAEAITTPGVNDSFIIEKTTNTPTLANALNQEVTFNIKLTAKVDLTAITISDRMIIRGATEATITEDTTPNPISPPCASTIPATLATDATWTCQITILALGPPRSTTYDNSTIINTVTASATLADGTTKTDSATATVRIGSPSSIDPSGWPTCGYIAQGPYQPPTHNHFRSFSAVDIQTDADGWGDNVYATQDGTVTSIMTQSTNLTGGNGVIITGPNYATLYAHFGTRGEDGGIASTISLGSAVRAGDLIGFRGDSGNAIMPHVHYSILDPSLNDISEADFRAHVPVFSVGDTVPSTWGPCK